jgi:hypothetical protein
MSSAIVLIGVVAMIVAVDATILACHLQALGVSFTPSGSKNQQQKEPKP